MIENRCFSRDVAQFYSDIELREDLAFDDLTLSEMNPATHRYHSYPAKFTPLLINRLLDELTEPNDCIWDPFCGSGTLNVEAFRSDRNSLGSDINSVAVLIAKAKTTPIPPDKLNKFKSQLFESIEKDEARTIKYYHSSGVLNGNLPELKKWYSESNLCNLSKIIMNIKKSKQDGFTFRNFALCCFSSILKRTSYWLASSIKPQLDYEKNPADPTSCFKQQFNRMERINSKFYDSHKDCNASARLFRHDATHELPVRYSKQVDHIITSPPYLVSYEYSDIFRLSSYFLDKYDPQSYLRFKKKFIGTKLHKKVEVFAPRSMQYIDLLFKNELFNLRRSKEAKILNYYLEMNKFIKIASHQIKHGRYFVLIVGDARVKSCTLPNAFLLSKIAEEHGFTLFKKNKRVTAGKNLPSYRNKENGKFVHGNDPNGVKVHTEEYILIFIRR